MNTARVSVQRALTGAGIAVAASLALTGCLGGTTTATESATPTPIPTVTVTVTPTQTPTPTPTPDPIATEEPAPVEPPPAVYDPEEEDPNAVVITAPTDNGVIPGATGSVQIDSAGVPYRYTVASGDIAVEIATRFHRYIWQLADKNAVMLTNPALIQPGQIILLTATEMPDGYVIPSR